MVEDGFRHQEALKVGLGLGLGVDMTTTVYSKHELKEHIEEANVHYLTSSIEPKMPGLTNSFLLSLI